MIETIYGSFSEEQFEEYKNRLHSKIFWLLLYKDPHTRDNYPEVDYEAYFNYLMREIDGFNKILKYPEQIVEIMNLLQAAFEETRKPDFDYKIYRKFILDAHSLVDKISGRSKIC